jgi:hypothetical protein
MTKTVARLALVVGLLVLTAFIVIVIGQTAQVVELAARIAPWL